MYRCKECKAEYKEKVDYCDCGNNTFDYIEDKKTVKQRQNISLEQKSEYISRLFFVLCIILSTIVWLIPISKTTSKKQSSKPVKQTVSKTIPNIDKIWDDTPLYQPKIKEQQKKLTPADYARRITETPSPKTNLQKSEQSRQISKTVSKSSEDKPTDKIVKKNDAAKPTKSIQKSEPIKKTQAAKTQSQDKTVQKNIYNPNSSEMLKYKGDLRSYMFSKLPVGSIQGSGECSVQFAIDLTGKIVNRKFTQESDNKSLNDAVYYMMMSSPKFTPPPVNYNGETIRMNFKFNNGDYEITIR